MMTYEEVRDYLAKGPGIIILPVGSTEQHGPHATMGIDTFATLAVSRPLAEELNALIAPDLSYAVSTPHRGWPGTIHIKPSTVTGLLVEIGTEILTQGFKVLIMITGHRGNEPALKCALDEIPPKAGTHVLALAYQDANKGRMDVILRKPKDQILKEDMAYGSDGHGGSCECSLAMAERPACVHLDRRIVPDRTLIDLRRNLGLTAALPIDKYATQGIFGDPSNISLEYGKYLAAETAKEIARRVRLYLKTFGG